MIDGKLILELLQELVLGELEVLEGRTGGVDGRLVEVIKHPVMCVVNCIINNRLFVSIKRII